MTFIDTYWLPLTIDDSHLHILTATWVNMTFTHLNMPSFLITIVYCQMISITIQFISLGIHMQNMLLYSWSNNNDSIHLCPTMVTKFMAMLRPPMVLWHCHSVSIFCITISNVVRVHWVSRMWSINSSWVVCLTFKFVFTAELKPLSLSISVNMSCGVPASLASFADTNYEVIKRVT